MQKPFISDAQKRLYQTCLELFCYMMCNLIDRGMYCCYYTSQVQISVAFWYRKYAPVWGFWSPAETKKDIANVKIQV